MARGKVSYGGARLVMARLGKVRVRFCVASFGSFWFGQWLSEFRRGKAWYVSVWPVAG
jgi:hypothetical protein